MACLEFSEEVGVVHIGARADAVVEQDLPIGIQDECVPDDALERGEACATTEQRHRSGALGIEREVAVGTRDLHAFTHLDASEDPFARGPTRLPPDVQFELFRFRGRVGQGVPARTEVPGTMSSTYCPAENSSGSSAVSRTLRVSAAMSRTSMTVAMTSRSMCVPLESCPAGGVQDGVAARCGLTRQCVAGGAFVGCERLLR